MTVTPSHNKTGTLRTTLYTRVVSCIAHWLWPPQISVESSDVWKSPTSLDWWSQGVKGCSSQLRAQERKFCIYLVVSTRHYLPPQRRAINPGGGILQLHSDSIPLVYPLPRGILFQVTDFQLSNSMEEKLKNGASLGFSHFLPESSLSQMKAHNSGQLSKNYFHLTLGFTFSFRYLQESITPRSAATATFGVNRIIMQSN